MSQNTQDEVKAQKKKPTERKSRFATAVDEEALEFIHAIEEFKEANDRAFPSWTEVLKILKGLGYEKVRDAPPQD